MPVPLNNELRRIL